MNRRKLLIFDMDGVLVDVTDSYREAIRETVRQFTGISITHKEIQAAKNRGGSNNDWELSLELIRARGASPSLEEVIAAFQRVYLGEGNTGLISRERWLPREQLLERLALRFHFALFTGRERWEAEFTLSKFAPGIRFDPLVGMEDVEFEKPHPEGLLKILDRLKPEEPFYVGDVMDDCLAAKAASVPFIGVVPQDNPLAVELERLFRAQGARAVVADINELEQVLP